MALHAAREVSEYTVSADVITNLNVAPRCADQFIMVNIELDEVHSGSQFEFGQGRGGLVDPKNVSTPYLAPVSAFST